MQACALSRLNQGEISMSTTIEQRNLEIVNKFCADWSKLSSPVMLPYFTADAVYHNMPGPPLVGQKAIGDFLAPFWPTLDSLVFEMLNIAANGHVVFTERLDCFRFKNGGKLDLPVNGIFELTADGKISQWREYWDLATWTKQGGPV
jgi:limonene-1,2-epoxide hydrolase